MVQTGRSSGFLTSHSRSPYHQLRRQNHATGSPKGVLYELEQGVGRFGSLLPDALSNRRERWIKMRSKVEIVEPGQSHVGRNTQPAGADGLKSTFGRRVVGAKNAVDAPVQKIARRRNP